MYSNFCPVYQSYQNNVFHKLLLVVILQFVLFVDKLLDVFLRYNTRCIFEVQINLI